MPLVPMRTYFVAKLNEWIEDYKYMKDNQTIFVGLKFRKKDVFDLSANLLGHGRNYWNQRN